MSNPIQPDKLAAMIEARDLFPDADAKDQCNRVLAILERGFMLSTFEASRHLDVYYCPARILELRAQGYNIITHWVTVTTEAGKPHRVGNYMLMRGVEHAVA